MAKKQLTFEARVFANNKASASFEFTADDVYSAGAHAVHLLRDENMDNTYDWDQPHDGVRFIWFRKKGAVRWQQRIRAAKPSIAQQLIDEVAEAFTSGDWIVKTKDGTRMTRVETDDKNCYTICDCYNDEVKPYEEIPLERAEANARLIAEAKNMYELLKDSISDRCRPRNVSAEMWVASSRVIATMELIKRINKL